VAVRALTVFLATYLLGTVGLMFTYHAFLERAGMPPIALCALVFGSAFGVAAGWWNWALRHQKAFLGASFAAGMTMLLPFLLVTYGYALVAFPLVLLWTGTNLAGLRLTMKWRKAG
jgi:hypothetical protein